MQFERRIIDEGKGKTHTRLWCACGFDVSDTRALDPDHDYLMPSGAVEPERFNHYERNQCVYCGRQLTGRQKLYCSNRCRMRYNRGVNANKRER